MKIKTNKKIVSVIFALIFIAIAVLFFASYREPANFLSTAEISSSVTNTAKQSNVAVEKKIILPPAKNSSNNQTAQVAESKPVHNQNKIVQEPAVNFIKVTLAVVRPIQSIQGRQSSPQAGDNGSTWLTTGKYDISVQKGATVYDTMTTLASTTQFSFNAKYYSGLGYFIDAINGIKNANGNYWTLYVNGTYATVGASAYRLSANDSIEWKYSDKANY